MTPGYAAFKMGFQLSPIILCGGIAADIPCGGMLPIIAFTEAMNFVTGILSGGENIELDDFFAHYQPLPGSTLIDNTIGSYPFANQSVAANAIIAQPIKISMLMTCPARNDAGYAVKLATMELLKTVLDMHINQGGTFCVVTPSYIYMDCLLTVMRDVSGAGSKQPQSQWQLDFVQPLLSLNSAGGALGSLMSKISGGSQVTSSATSGLSVATGVGAAPDSASIIPSMGSVSGILSNIQSSIHLGSLSRSN